MTTSWRELVDEKPSSLKKRIPCHIRTSEHERDDAQWHPIYIYNKGECPRDSF